MSSQTHKSYWALLAAIELEIMIVTLPRSVRGPTTSRCVVVRTIFQPCSTVTQKPECVRGFIALQGLLLAAGCRS